MSSMPPLLAPAGVKNGGGASNQQPSRAVSGVVAKPARGFQVFRVDGYSWTKTLPAGECISSETFTVGGRAWQIDYFPNGTDASKPDSDAIAVYLRFVSSTGYSHLYRHNGVGERVRAQFKFSLLDLSGSPAYELPTETGVFSQGQICGNAEFIVKEELERRRDSLIISGRTASPSAATSASWSCRSWPSGPSQAGSVAVDTAAGMVTTTARTRRRTAAASIRTRRSSSGGV